MKFNTPQLVLTLILTLINSVVFAEFRSANEPFTMALTGDSIITRKLTVYDEPEYLEMLGLIREADVAFTNLEVLFHDYEPYPMAESGGTWMRADPALAEDLAWAGFDLVSRANNHTGDYGVLGMQLTSKYVAEAGILDAGVGNSLAEAREAKFLETSKARVAMISVASSFAKHMAAGRSRDDVPPRPGLNPLRYTTKYTLPPEKFNRLKETGESLGQFSDGDGGLRGYDPEKPGEMTLFGRKFYQGDSEKVETFADAKDVEEIAAVVSSASRMADFVIVTIHAHEGPSRSVPADFVEEFARKMVDAGADVFVGHGPHALRGIEMYKGKPIMYSLGDFIFQNETLQRYPSGNYERFNLGENDHLAEFNDARYKNDTVGFPVNPEIWEAVIAMPTFKDQKLSSLALYPVTLGYGLPRQVRGRPILADKKLGEKIINDLIERSAPYGTEIEFKRGVGYVKLGE